LPVQWHFEDGRAVESIPYYELLIYNTDEIVKDVNGNLKDEDNNGNGVND